MLNTKGNKDCIHVDSQYKLGWETNECTDNRDYCAGIMAGDTHFRVTWEVAGKRGSEVGIFISDGKTDK